MDYFQFLSGAISGLLNQNASLFEAMGMNLFRGFSLIVVSWFGVQSALLSASGGGGFNWAKFAGLVQELILCYAMLSFYTVPIPGFGISFTHLILDQVQNMVGLLDQTTLQGVLESLNGLDSNLPVPAPIAVLEIIRSAILGLCIVTAQAAALVVVMYGYVATAVIILLGPVFIPFKLIPQMEFMFWGWFKAFLQYAFYQAVSAAYVFVFGHFLMQVLETLVSGPLSSTDMALLFGPLVLTLVTFVLGIIKIPALTNALFSGRAGDYVTLGWR